MRDVDDVIDTMDSLIEDPAREPLDLGEVKKQRRFGPTTLDTLFALWISGARILFEEQTGRQLISAIWELWLETFPGDRSIEIPHPPLQEVLSVTYDDGSADGVVMDDSLYRVINPRGANCRRGRITLVSGTNWPTVTACHQQAVRIRYRAGFGDAPGAVPETIRIALMGIVGHMHKYGEAVQDPRTTLAELPLGPKLIMEAHKYLSLQTLAPRRSWAA